MDETVNSPGVASKVDIAVALIKSIVDSCIDRETLRKKFMEKFSGDRNIARVYFNLALRRLAKAGEIVVTKSDNVDVICRSERKPATGPNAEQQYLKTIADVIQYGILKAFVELFRRSGRAVLVAPLGTKRVKKPSGKVYEYVYVRLNTEVWPEIADAYKVRLRVAPSDLSMPPVVVLARRFQGGTRSVAFDVPREYQKLVREYARNGVIAILDVEVVERHAKKSESL